MQAPPIRHRRDIAARSALVLGFLVLYGITLQGRLYGNDAAHFADWVAAGKVPPSYHSPAYPEIALAVMRLFHLADPLRALQSLSALSVAIGLGFAHALFRRLAVAPSTALAATLLLGVTPVTWFFATTIENHALHFAAVCAAASTTLALPWHRPTIAIPAAALLLGLIYPTHPTTPLLGPAFLLLAIHARARCARAFSPWASIGVGSCLLLGLLAGHLGNNLMRGVGAVVVLGESTGAIESFAGSSSFRVVLDTWLLPCFLVAPLSLSAACVLRPPWRAPQAALLAAVVPALAFFLWWGVPERGAYLLGSLPFAIALIALAIPLSTKRRRLLAGLVIAGQATFALLALREFDSKAQLADRVTRVDAELADGDLLLSGSDNAPDIRMQRPRVREVNLASIAMSFAESDAMAAAVVAMVRDELGRQHRVVLDLSYRGRWDFSPLMHHLERTEAALRLEFAITELPDASWPLLRIEQR